MSIIQVVARQPGIHVKNEPQLGRFPSRPRTLPMNTNCLSMSSLVPGPKPSSGLPCLPVLKSQQPLHVCFAGGRGMMENNEDSQWKSLERAMDQFKGQSIEDILRQQMEKGGGGVKPPRGRGGGGGGGSNSGGSEEGDVAGMSDETLQVVLATIGFIIVYMNVINGLEFAKLLRDFIKFLSGRGQSARLKRALYKWVQLYKNISEKKEVVKNGLEKASTWKKEVVKNGLEKASTWRLNPDLFRGVVRH